jgi:hypothetical protein
VNARLERQIAVLFLLWFGRSLGSQCDQRESSARLSPRSSPVKMQVAAGERQKSRPVENNATQRGQTRPLVNWRGAPEARPQSRS